MPINRDFIGRSFPPGQPYEVSREKIREFADAIGDPNPIYRDTEAAKALGHPDVIAPPTFPIVLSLRAGAGIIFDPSLGLDYSRVVHGEQRFTYRRPVRVGDALVATPTIIDIRDAGSNELMTIRHDIKTTEGEQVCEAINTIVSRGTASGKAS